MGTCVQSQTSTPHLPLIGVKQTTAMKETYPKSRTSNAPGTGNHEPMLVDGLYARQLDVWQTLSNV